MAYIGTEPIVGQYRVIDSISSSFNGATTTFNLKVSGSFVTAGSAQQLLVSLGGVVQSPGVDYTVSTNSITFTTPPIVGLSCFMVLMGDTLDIGAPSDSTVTPSKINFTSLGNYANDAAAASGGVAVGGLYRNGSVIQIRVT